MDISGYRGRPNRIGNPGGSWAAGLDDPSGKNKRGRGLSLGARALLLLLLVLVAWGAIRSASRKGAPAAASTQAKTAGATATGSAGGGAAAAAAGRTAAANRGGGSKGKQAKPKMDPAAKAQLQARLDQQAETRIERQMRITPTYRGPGKAETFPHLANANRVLLASHNRLAWYRYDTGELRVLHEDEGVYYGAFPGGERDALGMPTTLWVVLRPHDWRAAGAAEQLLHLDMESGRELGRVQLGSRFAHDAVRRRDRVYVASTGDGAVLELDYPSMQQLRKLELFTAQQHVNTLGPTHNGKLWALLHNKGASDVVQLDLGSGAEEARFPWVGTKAHGLAVWDKHLLLLDSEGGALVRLDTAANQTARLWQAPPGTFLKGLCVVDDIALFGACPNAPSTLRSDPQLSCQLAAFDLKAGLLLWRRELPTRGLLNYVAAPHLSVESTTYASSTRQLITYRDKPAFEAALAAAEEAQRAQERAAQGAQAQLVGQGEQQQAAAQVEAAAAHVADVGEQQAQQLAQQQAQAAAAAAAAQQQADAAAQAVQAVLAAADKQQQQTADMAVARRALSEAPQPLPSGAAAAADLDSVPWSSGLPRLRLAGKADGQAAGAQLQLLQADVSGLQAALAALPEGDWAEAAQRASNAWIAGRSALLGAVKPGVDAILLQFSSQDGRQVVRFPWYARFAHWVEPLLAQVLGPADAGNVVRLQLARMAPGARILPHTDTGGYAAAGHRIHVVLQTNPGVAFHVCDTAAAAAGSQPSSASDSCVRLAAPLGSVFELNNLLPHWVANDGGQPRTHLVVDVAESPRRVQQLAAGQVCTYTRSGQLSCPGLEDPAAAAAAAAEE